MSVTKFTPLQLGLIDEGRFIAQADSDLSHLQEEMVGFMREHKGLAKKSKAVLTLKITLTCEDVENRTFSVKAEANKKVPSRPASLTLALEGEDDHETPCLFVRRSGSTDDSPAQDVLATKDGRTVNPETGEPVEGEPAAKKPKE
jgi:hypothetical protein